MKRIIASLFLVLSLVSLTSSAQTTLFSGNLTIPSGNFETSAFQPPQGFSGVDIVMNADPFPTGTTTISIAMSFDGGVTFPPERTASMTWDAPHTFPAKFAHIVKFGFSIAGADHVKVETNSPAQFTTSTTITAQ